jgi:hypothetical protein
VPKDVMRHAAMAAALNDANPAPGTEYDTQKGLDFLFDRLYDLRTSGAPYARLQEVISVRRGGRGQRGPLSPEDQMLLVESIRDLAREAYRTTQEALPSLKGRDSTIEFAGRFAQAFPGVRGIAWFDNPDDVKQRLEKLFEAPLVYSDATPVWWFGDGSLQIESFRSLAPCLYLMNRVEELKIRRIAAVHGRSYYQSFVYVECGPLPPTGL